MRSWSRLRAPCKTVGEAIMTLLDLGKAASLAGGAAGDSTGIERMSGQCLEVMSEYPALLEAHRGRHDEVLG